MFQGLKLKDPKNGHFRGHLFEVIQDYEQLLR